MGRADEVADGHHDSQFVVDVFQSGGGAPTSEPRPDTVVLAQAGWVF